MGPGFSACNSHASSEVSVENSSDGRINVPGKVPLKSVLFVTGRPSSLSKVILGTSTQIKKFGVICFLYFYFLKFNLWLTFCPNRKVAKTKEVLLGFL